MQKGHLYSIMGDKDFRWKKRQRMIYVCSLEDFCNVAKPRKRGQHVSNFSSASSEAETITTTILRLSRSRQYLLKICPCTALNPRLYHQCTISNTMGIVISTTTLSPFSVVTGIIGLVSFAFTVGTFLKVVWTNLETMMEAPHEVHGYLTNLRQELLEERSSLRHMRKMCRRHIRDGSVEMDLDEVSLKTMSDTIRSLLKKFEGIERPFLGPGEEGIKQVTHHHPGGGKRGRRRRSRGDSASPYYTHSAYAPMEKGHRGRNGEDAYDDDDPTDPFWAQRMQYGQYSLVKRIKWIWYKPDAQSLMSALTRAQVRRVARQVGGMVAANYEGQRDMDGMHEMVRRIDERMSRFVGVRRVSGREGGGGHGDGDD
nr:hypothetical protein CFP56_08151 [Quercus suber]